MIVIAIGDKDYNLPTSWSEITLSRCVELARLCDDMPDGLRKLYAASEPLDDECEVKYSPEWYGRVISLLAEVPVELMSQCQWYDRTVIYRQYLEKIVLECMASPNEVEQITTFTHNGTEYHLPMSAPSMSGDQIGANVTTIEFTECADLEIYSRQLKGGKLEVMANIVSILCRPKGEKYNEQVSLIRAKEFASLPMSTVWSVFFSLVNYMNSSLSDSLTLAQEVHSRLQRLNTAQE
jgi:hypothetical protein